MWPLGLVAVLLLVHFLADFTPLSSPWMLEAKKRGWPPLPIAAHALVHAAMMILVFLLFRINGWGKLLFLFGFLFCTHFVIDTLKGRLAIWKPVTANPNAKAFWVAFGADQLLHQVAILQAVAMASQ